LAWQGERLRWRLFHPISLGARVIVLREREVLLVRHTYRAGWFLPGGAVDKGETLEVAARREAREEACVDIGALHLLGVYTNFSEGMSDHVAVFVTREFTIGEFMPGNEIAECRWFALDALPHELSPATRQRLAELEPGAPPVADSW
jgi:ADP-ribose pyrophosphatase YjhB (NUDIX family)